MGNKKLWELLIQVAISVLTTLGTLLTTSCVTSVPQF
jgi:hypothetical protein